MRPSVLVVDDERSFRLLADEALSSEGFDVRTASTLARARVELDQTAPDVMILDRRLPDGDGIDLLRELAAGGRAHRAGHRGHRLRRRAQRRRGAPRRRGRLPDQAAPGHRPHHQAAQGAGGAGAARPARAGQERLAEADHGAEERRRAGGGTQAEAGGREPAHARLPRRPLGRGQAVRGGDAAPRDVRGPARRRALRGGQLRRAPRPPGGERALRARARRVHRRQEHAARPHRDGRRRHPLPRRDRRAARAVAGQAAQVPRHDALPPPGRAARDRGLAARRRGDQPARLAPRLRPPPRGPLPSPLRLHGLHPPALPAPGGHPRAASRRSSSTSRAG